MGRSVTQPWPDDPREFVLAYLAAWNVGDVDRACDAFHVPALLFADGAVQPRLDEVARRDWIGGYVDSTRGELAAGTRWTCPSLDVRTLGPDSALAMARWVFTRADGTVLEDYPDAYLLVRTGGRWAFMADIIDPGA